MGSGKHSGQRHTHIHTVYMLFALSCVKMHWESLAEWGNGCVQGTGSKAIINLRARQWWMSGSGSPRHSWAAEAYTSVDSSRVVSFEEGLGRTLCSRHIHMHTCLYSSHTQNCNDALV